MKKKSLYLTNKWKVCDGHVDVVDGDDVVRKCHQDGVLGHHGQLTRENIIYCSNDFLTLK